MEKTAYGLIDDLRRFPGYMEEHQGLLNVSTLHLAMHVALPAPAPGLWTLLAAGLSELVAGNFTGTHDTLVASLLAGLEGLGADESIYGIRCGDKAPRHEDLGTLLPALEAGLGVSRLGGGNMADVHTRCAQWRFEAKERPSPGDFSDVRTRNPVLVLNNRWDPLTSIVSARNVSASFPGSVVLETAGYGVSD